MKQGSKFVEGINGVSHLQGEEALLGQARRKRIDKETDGRLNPKSISIAVQPDINSDNTVTRVKGGM